MILNIARPLADIVICILLSLLMLIIVLTNQDGTIRIILGLPYLLFFPGYVQSFAIFPIRKSKTRIDTVERLALSFALSLAIIPIIGLILNFTPEGLQLEPILQSFLFYITGFGLLALYRWHLIPPKERVFTTLNITIPEMGKNLDTALTLIVVLSVICAPASLIYVIISPRAEESFTEFYILGSDRTTESFQRDLAIGENSSIIIGISNHEHKTINYTIEIWLIDQSIVFNETTLADEMVYNHMWYINKLSVVLNHTSVDIYKGPWKPQWEYPFNFKIMRKGEFNLLFFLFTESTETYSFEEDYIAIIEQKINTSYRETNLWIEVSNLPKIYNVSINPPLTLQDGFINISCNIFDYDGVDEVYLRLRDPDRNLYRISITNNKSGNLYYCNRTYTIPGEYEFYIIANDTTNNISQFFDRFYIEDIPQIPDVWANPNLTRRGRYVNISCLIYDADGLREVFLNITYPDDTIHNFSIIENKTGYLYNSNKRYFSVGTYRYYIWVNDTRGNTNQSDINEFKITLV